MQERVGKYLEDPNVAVLTSFIVLFSTDSLHAPLSNQVHLGLIIYIYLIVMFILYLNDSYIMLKITMTKIVHKNVSQGCN